MTKTKLVPLSRGAVDRMSSVSKTKQEEEEEEEEETVQEPEQIGSRTATMASTVEAKVVEQKILDSNGEFRWIRLNKIKWIDERKRERQWESAERTTRKQEIDGVCIVAQLKGGDLKEPVIILVSQFRPPTHSYCLELPAGLVDEGEDAGQAALRELKEECGFVGTVSKVSPVLFSDPGMTNANMRYVFADVDMNDDRNKQPKTEQEDGECITTHHIPVSKLMDALTDPKQYFGKDYAVDARLFSWAQGLVLGLSMGKL